MLQRCVLTLILISPAGLKAGSIMPTATGTTWPYKMTQELGEGVALPGSTPDEAGRIQNEVLYRLDGTEDFNGQTVLKFEMHRGGLVTNTDLMLVDDNGVRCVARIGLDGERIPLTPPQTMVLAPLKRDLSWDFDGQAAGTEVHQHYVVVGEENVTVPAGRFHAFHILGEQTAPDRMTIERWFAGGVGIVKDVTTTRSKDGDLMRRIELVLTGQPKVAPRPEVQPPKPLSTGVSGDAVGAFATKFSTETPKLYARWQGHGLRDHAKIRAVWIAEDVGDVAPANYTIDEATATATVPEAHGAFTLSRPSDGWAPGAYRVEFYLDGDLVDTVKIKISAPDRFN